MASFSEALEDNPAPRQLGDVRLRYEPGRLLGESRAPSYWKRLLPTVCLGMAVPLTLLALVGAWVEGARQGLGLFWVPGLLAAALVGLALWLEGQLGRRRFVLHFRSERLRLERLRWAPGATRAQWVPFDEVTAVDVVERPDGNYALVVVWRAGDEEETPPRREVLVEHILKSEQEALLRVWRMLHNAFGLRGAGLAGG
ncbi:hypothetical protein D187_006050 [Cystobacter fuscus DSM 2262]|uniref:Uncharacterized protein n=1 Tax=Cystobacter fuscus (strain ATCC 25194 / DSM 2262 / NBRC 100088 / M29) TaxID=1242864 RepID=S9PMI6_CYSF2|nr:hypothetical protein [Cystobacter fuscus]EPX63642.1 hypothetical protein D187_006050 [Cystobacter fuscus DSM 2262]